MTESERESIEAVRAGHIERFSDLVRRHQDQVYRVLLRLTRDPELAQDLTQTAFIRAYENLSGFRGEASFATWVTQIAIHLARDAARRGANRAETSLEALVEDGGNAFDPVDEGLEANPLERLTAAEWVDALERELESLPEAYREVFVMRHVLDLDYEQIAAITGDRTGALKVRNHRARKHLLRRIAARLADQAPSTPSGE